VNLDSIVREEAGDIGIVETYKFELAGESTA